MSYASIMFTTKRDPKRVNSVDAHGAEALAELLFVLRNSKDTKDVSVLTKNNFNGFTTVDYKFNGRDIAS